MTTHVFAVYDGKAEAYTAPFTANTFGLAERMFSDLINEPGHPFNRHPGDYTLYVIGQFDTHTSLLSATELKPIASGLQVSGAPDPVLREMGIA